MAINCNNCARLIKSTAITLEWDVLKIQIPNQTLHNGEKMCLFISQLGPCWTGPAPRIAIMVDGVQLNAITSCGNYLYADQFKSCNGMLKTKQIIPLRIATDSDIVVYDGTERLCNSANYIAPITETVTPPAQS